MSRSRKALLQVPVVLLALASTPGLLSVSSFLNQAAFAQSSEAELTDEERTLTLPETFDSKPSFTVPQSLAEDTSVTVNGSSSMTELNKILQQRFQERFPDSEVELTATGTNEALEALQKGELDLAAVGRPLTEAEKAAGLVAVPVGREKLAIIVSPDNPFDGNLTFEQFAQIFRGEITNWSEVGDTDGEIQFVDRPDDSDTRRALSTYDVFEGVPFETGFNTTQVGEDETDAVVAELGDNGIGYAIVDQVLNRDDVKIISMHQTLPDDPRYPYSQYRSYVYNQNKEIPPAVVAFLGLATTEPGQEVVGAAAVPVPRETSEETTPVAPPATTDTSAGEQVAQTPGAVATAEDEAAGFPLWLIPLLLGIPLIGGLVWFLRGGQGQPIGDATPPVTGTGTATPPVTGTGTATPPVTGTGTATPPVTGTGTATPPATGTGTTTPPATGTGIPTTPPVTGNGVAPVTTTPPVTPPVTGGIPGTGSVSGPPATGSGRTGLGAVAGIAGGLAAAGAAAWWAGREPSSRITLTPGDGQDAYAYWNVPDGDQNFAKEKGGEHPQLRIYDVTDIENPDQQTPSSVQKYDWDELTKERVVPNLEGNRDYLAEIGYATRDDQWLMLARSNQIHIPEVETPIDGITPNVGGLVGAGLIGAGGAAALIPLLTRHGSHITLRLTDTPQTAEADWDVPDAAKTAAKEHGGQYPQLRICDVTGIDDVDRHLPNDIQKYDWDEWTQRQQFPNLDPNCTYLAEIGYETDNAEWLRLARSNRVTIPEIETPTQEETTPDAGVIPGLIGAGLIGAGGGAALIPLLTRHGSHITLGLTDTPQTAEADWDVPDAAKTAAKEHGGQYPQVRICDVTGIDDVDRHLPNDIQKYDWDEWTQRQQFPNLDPNCTYLAEIGYETDNAEWLRLARSNRVTIPEIETPTQEETTPDAGVIPGLIGAGLIGAGGGAALISSNRDTVDEVETPTEEETTPDAGVIPGLIGAGGLLAVIGVLTRYGSHITLKLTDTPQTAEADWEVPNGAKTTAKNYGGQYPQVRICDVTGIDDLDRQQPNEIQKYDWNEWNQRQEFPNLDPARTYLAEIGYETDDDQWLRLARSNRVTIPEIETPIDETTPDGGMIPGLIGAGGLLAVIGMLTRYGSHITLRLTDTSQTVEADWEVPNGAKTTAKEYGGQYPQVRLCDVTGIDDLDRQQPNEIQKYHWDEFTQERVFPDLESDRTYLAEIGYETGDDQWLRLARSNRVTIAEVETPTDETRLDLGLIGVGGETFTTPEVETPTEEETTTPDIGVSPGLIGLGLGGAAAIGGMIPQFINLGSDISLNLADDQTAEARWQVPDGAKTAAKQQGGRQMQLRIYDVTDVGDLETQSPNRVRRYDCEESTQERRIPIVDQNCEYLAEIGYMTDDGNWLLLARSSRVFVPETEVETSNRGTSWPTETPVPLSSFGSSVVLIPTGERTADVRWDIPEEAKEVAKGQGGRQLQLRVYDVTNTNGEQPGRTLVKQYDCDESDWQLELEDDRADIPQGDRDYQAEIGYVSDDGNWLLLAGSEPVRIPANRSNQGLIAGLAGAGVAVGSRTQDRTTPTTSSVTLIPSDNGAANVYWIVPDAVQEEVKQQGGRQFQLHVYDVTDIPPDSLATHNVEQYNFDPAISGPQFLELEGNHDYFAEIGYLTDDGEWLMVARSYRVRIPAATSVAPFEPAQQPSIELTTPESVEVATLDPNRCRVTLIPSDNEAANVYWDVPDGAIEEVKQRGGNQFQLHVYDVTDIPPDSLATHDVQQYDFDVSQTHPELLRLEGNHEYFAEIGYLTADGEWLRLAQSYRVRIPAATTTDLPDVALIPGVFAIPGLASIPCRMILTLSEDETVDVEWEVPDAAKALAKQEGGYQFQVRAYDVTNTSVETPPSSPVEECPIAESISNWEFELQSDREYLAEVGYITEDGRWLVLARSNRLFVTFKDKSDGDDSTAVALTEVRGTEQPLSVGISSCYITLSIYENEWVDARWEVPDAAKADAKQQGGQKFQLHVYEVTDIDLQTQPAHSVQRYNCNELIKQWQVPNLKPNCEYLVEIGYVTDGAEWLMLARSNRVRVPESSGVAGEIREISPEEAASSRITLTATDNLSANAYWEMPRVARQAAKQRGGEKFQLRIYDVTGIDLETESATIVRRYNCHELIQQLQIPNLGTNRDYLVEMGYLTHDDQWLILARSNSVRIAGISDRLTLGQETNISTVSTGVPQQEVTTGNCAIQHLTLDSRRHCHLLNEEYMKQLQEVGVSHLLEPGIYVIRIKSGSFGYGPTFVGEPFVIFWIYGGKIINKKTRVTVDATWSTLNGYHETLTLEIQETSNLCAFFFDTYPDDNEGEVTLSIARLYDAL